MDLVCRQLNYAGLLQILHGAPHGTGGSPLLSALWNCGGHGLNVLECETYPVNSSYFEVATVACEIVNISQLLC